MKTSFFRAFPRAALACAVAACLAPLPGAARAETTLYVGNVAPYSFPEGAPQRGLVYDLVHETALRAGHSGIVNIVPLRRQTEMILRGSDALGSVTRLPEREASFSWPVRLFQERLVLVTLAGSPVDIDTPGAAKDLRIGVVLGGPAESVARHAGFAHIQAADSNRSNVSKLAVGRVDAILALGGLFAANEGATDAGYPPLREGAVVGLVDVYLAGPPGMPAAQAAKWSEAFKALRRDGGYARIMQRYHRQEEP